MTLLGPFAMSLAAVFVVVEPFGTLPFYSSITAGRSPRDVRAIALRASLLGSAILAAFALFGERLLSALHVRLGAFQVAGGLLLMLTALEMLRGKAPACRCTPTEATESGDDPAIVPLAFPLLAGPGAMVTVLTLSANHGRIPVLAAIVLTFVVSYAVLRAAAFVERTLGRGTFSVLQRLLGLVVAAMSVQLVADGARGLLL